MSQYATFTRNASKDCRRFGVDEEEVRELLDAPDTAVVPGSAEPDDPNWVWHHALGRLEDGLVVEVTFVPRPDRRLVYRVRVLPADGS